MSTVSEGFFKQLRKDVKNKASNHKIHQFLNSIYDEGYRQGIKAATQRAQEIFNVSNENANIVNHNDGIGLGTGSSEPQERDGTDAIDANSDSGSEPDVQSAAAQ